MTSPLLALWEAFLWLTPCVTNNHIHTTSTTIPCHAQKHLTMPPSTTPTSTPHNDPKPPDAEMAQLQNVNTDSANLLTQPSTKVEDEIYLTISNTHYRALKIELLKTIQVDKATAVHDDLIQIIEEAQTYIQKPSTHQAIFDKLSPVPEWRVKACQLFPTHTFSNPTYPCPLVSLKAVMAAPLN